MCIRDSIFNNQIFSDTDKLREIFIKNGSDKYTLEAIDIYTQNAINAIESDSNYEKVLIDLTRYCSTRTR